MADKPGKFTQQFDVEVLKKFLDTPENDALAQEIQEKMGYIEEKMEKRKKFLLERFDNARATDTAKGICVVFNKTAKYPSNGKLEFTFTINEETKAIIIDYSMEMDGMGVKKDYVTMALKKFEPQKVDNFIESKILQFAKTYVQGGRDGD